MFGVEKDEVNGDLEVELTKRPKFMDLQMKMAMAHAEDVPRTANNFRGDRGDFTGDAIPHSCLERPEGKRKHPGAPWGANWGAEQAQTGSKLGSKPGTNRGANWGPNWEQIGEQTGEQTNREQGCGIPQD